jgi:hypothetical protein
VVTTCVASFNKENSCILKKNCTWVYFAGYFRTLPVARLYSAERRDDKRIEKDLERKTVVAYSINFPKIGLEGLGKTMKTLSRDIQCPGRDTNLKPPKYESKVLPLCQSSLLSFEWFSEQTAICSLNSINRLGFVAEKRCVSCEVRTQYLNIVAYSYRPKRCVSVMYCHKFLDLGLAATLYNCIREMLGSNLGRVTLYPEIRGFPQYLD